ncbi:MAG: type II secretion system F family protein [Actinobacteria bacterium]|nr:type II secretion system F family protein [Actinomycetota bacterium]
MPRRDRKLLGAGIAAGLLAFAITGWPVAGLAVPVAFVGIPRIIAPSTAKNVIERLEGLEEWTRALAGSLTVGLGLEQAIIRTTRNCPAAIESELGSLSRRLKSRWPTDEALLAFADEVADPTGDLIVAALIASARRRGPGLSDALESLANTVADDVRSRRMIESDRAKPRATARWVTIITLLVLGLLAFNSDYLSSYSTPSGQLLLALFLSAYAGGLLWMQAVARGKPAPRLLEGGG